jgi:hypothetical protein
VPSFFRTDQIAGSPSFPYWAKWTAIEPLASAHVRVVSLKFGPLSVELPDPQNAPVAVNVPDTGLPPVNEILIVTGDPPDGAAPAFANGNTPTDAATATAKTINLFMPQKLLPACLP